MGVRQDRGASARGSLPPQFGADGPNVWISPLLTMFWFFSLPAVADSHLFLRELDGTRTIWDVTARVEAARKALALQDRSSIPI